MGGVLRYFSKVSGSGVDVTLLMPVTTLLAEIITQINQKMKSVSESERNGDLQESNGKFCVQILWGRTLGRDADGLHLDNYVATGENQKQIRTVSVIWGEISLNVLEKCVQSFWF